jgi:SM-20-related protein
MQSTESNQYYTEQQWHQWLDQLADNDFVYVDNFLPDDLYHQVQRYFKLLLNEQEFTKAGIGSSEKRQVKASVRGDFIYWLDQHQDEQLSPLFSLFDEVMYNLRQYLLLGLSDYEFHFALYPPQTRYEKHVVQFHGKKNRVISMLIYLNENWETGDGGELKIYQQNGKELLIEPLAKRLVLFKSDSVEHEVMVTNTGRKSLTGWLLRQPAALGQLV